MIIALLSCTILYKFSREKKALQVVPIDTHACTMGGTSMRDLGCSGSTVEPYREKMRILVSQVADYLKLIALEISMELDHR